MSFFIDESPEEIKLNLGKREDYEIESAYSNNLKNSLWVEKYRPKNINEYVGDENFKKRISSHIDSGDIPHILLYGPPGTGKTTVAKMVANSIRCDLLYMNASNENGIDAIREKVGDFASSCGFNDLKVIILDEFDYLSNSAQAALRATMETFSQHTRFIMTCNYHEKIMGAITSRCQVEQVIPPSKAHIAKHLSNILKKENIAFDIKDLAKIINVHYPDIRKIIGTAQQFSKVDSTLKLDEESISDSNIHVKIVDLLKTPDKDTFNQIRQIVADSGCYNFDTHYKYLFDTVDSWAGDKVSECIMVLAEMQYKSTTVPDREINFMSCIIQLLEKMR